MQCWRYLFACGLAHHAALQRVEEFASTNKIDVDRMGALPVPPSLLDWGGVIRSIDGVYQARFDLRNPAPPDFHFAADSPPDPFIARALQFPEVQLFWQFARFPVIRSFAEGGQHIVDIGENRFVNTRHKGTTTFHLSPRFRRLRQFTRARLASGRNVPAPYAKTSPQRSGETP